MIREKTNRKIAVPVLPKANEILEKYDDELSTISTKKLTHQIARKTFATIVLRYNNLPMEVVSELLGRSNVEDTPQVSYAKVVNKKVSSEMKNTQSKLLENKTPLL